MFRKLIVWLLTGLLGLAFSASAYAHFHLYRINELYSNADGTIQFIELFNNTSASAEYFSQGTSLTVTPQGGGTSNTFIFPSNLPAVSTAFTTVLIATQGFANLGIVTPDFIIPAGFLFINGGTINLGNFESPIPTYPALPTNGIDSLTRTPSTSVIGTTTVNSPKNFAGVSGTVPAPVSAPVLSALRPNSGSTAGGSTLTIDGTGLDSATSVTFGGTPATIVMATATALTVTTPAHAAGLVDVVVVNPGGSTSSTGAFTYVSNDDVARDFSIAANPSPRWSYGSEPTRGGTFTLYSTHARGSIDEWSFGGLPAIWHNPTTGTVQLAGTNSTPPGKFALHPGPNGEYSVVRWTAPASGTYRIVGDFIGQDFSYPTTTDVAVLQNNNGSAPLFSGNINSYNVPLNFSVDVTVILGDTIEFTVGTGGNGYFGDLTGLDATISLLVAASVPGAPTIGTATAGNAQATVSFTPPASNGGSPITSYTVTSNPGALTATGTTSPITVTGLTNGVAYTFTVTAQNAVGASAPSAPSNSVTPASAVDTTAPSVPTGLTATAVSASQINLAWTASTDNVGVALYQVFRGGVFRATVNAPTLNFSDTGLTASTLYSYTVAACDAAGNCSAQSSAAAATTLAPGQYAFNPELELGFNLIGNSLNITLDVVAIFGNQDVPTAITSNIVSIWKWNAVDGRWAFYSPQLTAAANASYAASHSYELLSIINPGEGYWVNAINPMSLPAQMGSAFNWNGFNFGALPSGFNLIADAGNVTPSQFNIDVSPTPPSPGVIPTTNFVSLWAWDAVVGNWYFYSPLLESSGGLTAVKSYADTHFYLHFQDYNKKLDVGTGFWVNRP